MDSTSPDRMLVAMIDVTGMSVARIRSLEASIKNYVADNYISTKVYDGGPITLRTSAFEVVPGRRVAQWSPAKEVEL